jgi:uncharacterized membrane protein YjdF
MLALAFAVIWALLAIAPHHRDHWLLDNAPVLLGVVV